MSAEEIKNVLDSFPEYEANIGIEVHVQLKTKTKIFCSCSNKFGSEPNSNICPVCAGYPGTLPILNRKVMDFAIMLGLATNCKIAKITEFSRKHYTYPDLPKNFQITQANKPICEDGHLIIDLPDSTEKKIRLIRIHMEEDAGKNIHAESGNTLVDLNRTGTPLLEIVSHPDLSNARETKTYLMRLKAIVEYLNISNANMEEGSFRADTNISVRKKESNELGTKVELKNINSFKFITQGINYEIKRQINLLQEGKKIAHETRLWDSKKQQSSSMRSKEETQDYRFLTEPDIPEILIDSKWIENIKKEIPELPHDKFKRFQKEYRLTVNEAEVLVAQPTIASFFEATTAICKLPKQVSNWMLRDLLGYIKENKKTLSECQITPETLAELVSVIDKGIINTKVAQDVFVEMVKSGKYPSIVIQELDLQQINSQDELEKIVIEIIKNNPDVVEKYKKGNERLFAFFIGQSMKATKGKGNPKIIQELLKKHLK
jgi:aspartyl-tRNA(Asn)/glutamyl-tRNA(Gln) amidotransferase subunit B